MNPVRFTNVTKHITFADIMNDYRIDSIQDPIEETFTVPKKEFFDMYEKALNYFNGEDKLSSIYMFFEQGYLNNCEMRFIDEDSRLELMRQNLPNRHPQHSGLLYAPDN